MTVRNAWGRMVQDYEAAAGKQVRPAYEEMRQTYYQMENGTAEGRLTGNLVKDAACSLI